MVNQMAKIEIDLGTSSLDAVNHNNEKLAKLTNGLPSVSAARNVGLKHAPRVQLSFTNVPKPIKAAFEAEAVKRGISQKALMYIALRGVGVDIPDDALIDRRKI